MQKTRGNRAFHNFVFRLHTWVGLHVCIALGLIFLSGTLLMFSPELTNIRQPSLWISPSSNAVSVGHLYDSTNASFPERSIDSIGSQPRPWLGRPVYFSGKGGSTIVHLSPETGEVLGQQVRRKLSLRNLIRKLHDSMLVPLQPAQVLVNALSFVVLALVITGLLTYRRFWTGFFLKVPKDANRLKRESSSHRRLAVWAAPFLIASALASSVFFLNSIGIKAKSGSAPAVVNSRPTGLPAEFDGNDVDAIISACNSEIPGLIERGIKFPKSGEEFVRVNGYESDAGEIFGAVTCYADPSSHEVTGLVRASDGNWMNQVKALAVAVHYGTFAGWLSIILWTLLGLVSTCVAISGAKVYAARAIVKSGGSKTSLAGRSTVSLLVQGLGYFKWLYVAWVLLVIALLLRDLF